MLIIALLSLMAGMLTVLAPCVLPFLPVIVGGSVQAGANPRRPYLIAGSLVVSLLAFTLLLKATTLLLSVDPMVWSLISGILVILLGVAMLVPNLWAKISQLLRLDRGSHELLDKAQSSSNGTVSALLTGAALGPVFSSCSPTYAWVLATVLPAEPLAGLLYLALYCLGLAIVLLAVSLLGRKLIDRLGWAANPRGWFQRIIAVLFIIVGLLVATGIDKRLQAWAVDVFPDFAAIEAELLPGQDEPAGQAEQTGSEQSAEADTQAALLPENYPAPELTGITDWLNSEPLTLAQLRGNVVLVDFWTYSCINCIRTQEYLNAWYDAYHDDGFEIIGVHAPEFAFEKLPENVRNAIAEAKIKYPVALDNDFATWQAYSNRYWPAKYLIDRDGNIRYVHFGEGDYDETENAIRALLGESGPAAEQPSDPMRHTPGQSPETYLGTERASGFRGSPGLQAGETSYQPDTNIGLNEWTLAGTWQVDDEAITAQADDAQLSYRFTGQGMFLVLDGPPGSSVQVTLEGAGDPGGADAESGTVSIDSARLYHLVQLPQATDGTTVTLQFSKGVSAHAFTFG